MSVDLDDLDSQWRTTGRVAIVALAATGGGWLAIYVYLFFWAGRTSPSILAYGFPDAAMPLFLIVPLCAALSGYLAAVLIKRPAIRRWTDSPIATRVSTLLVLCLLGASLIDLYISAHPLILITAAIMGLPGLAVALRTKSHIDEPAL
jgi:hypothetical protein